jgi:5'-nucleotidase
MKILLTNDDGIFAPGLAALYRELVKFGDVTVVAPADVKSGAGHSITFNSPLVCNRVKVNGLEGYSVCGSPADCVKLALNELISEPVNLVVSGMNYGANVGINVYYSGTVAAAMEAAFYHVPAVAMSLAWEEPVQFEKGASMCAAVLKKILPAVGSEVINVNIPRLSLGEPKGVMVVPQSTEGFAEHYITKKDDKEQTVYQLAGGIHRQEEALTDTICLADGYITVTALHYNMTHFEKTRELKLIDW